ncbi:WD40-repeat-containing domain protein [Lactarius indigo]|nr:WD40-repeat-containing domain protein [Lactarius indigo]KAI9435872.1 WD40-repeat-containing domain protein [Lactarius indigo]
MALIPRYLPWLIAIDPKPDIVHKQVENGLNSFCHLQCRVSYITLILLEYSSIHPGEETSSNPTGRTTCWVVLEVLVAGEQAKEDYITFREEIRPEWDRLHYALCEGKARGEGAVVWVLLGFTCRGKWYERSFHQSALTSVAFNSCSSLLATSSLDGLISVWEVNTGSLLHYINARTPVHSLVWSSEPGGFFFGCENGTLVSVFIEQYSQNGGTIQVTSLNWLYKCDSKEERNRFMVASYQWHGVFSSLTLAPDGTLAAIYSISHAFEVHDVETHRLVQALPFEAQSDLVSPPIAFAHDGFAIIGGVQGRACIWDTECGDELQALNHGGRALIWTIPDTFSNYVQTYSSEIVDMFLVAMGMDEGKTSWIVLWDTAPCVYDSNGSQSPLVNSRPQWAIKAKSPPTNQLTWAITGAAALLLGWGWMG